MIVVDVQEQYLGFSSLEHLFIHVHRPVSSVGENHGSIVLNTVVVSGEEEDPLGSDGDGSYCADVWVMRVVVSCHSKGQFVWRMVSTWQ